MNTATCIPPAQMVVNINDLSVVNDIRRALKLKHGVGRITLKKNFAPTYDITQTAGYKEAKEDIRKGRVYRAESVDDMFNQILTEQ